MDGSHSGRSVPSEELEEKEEVLDNETLESLLNLRAEIATCAFDDQLLIHRLSKFICRQKFRYPRPQSHFEKRVNETIHPIVDQWEILKNKGSLKIIDKLTANLLERVEPECFLKLALSFIGSMINEGASHFTNEYDFSFVISLKCLLATLESDYWPSGVRYLIYSLKLSRSQIVDGIIAWCSYARALSRAEYPGIENKQIYLREISDSLHNAVTKLGLKVKDDILPDAVSIGIDDRIEEVTRLLKTDDKDVKHTAVILHGVAGIGKTTLATEVINALKPSDFGFCYASVSLDSQRKDFETQAIELQSQIISQLACESAVVDCIGTGQAELRKVLSSRHCFIFVDNVVEGQQLHDVFPQDLPNNRRLRILVTSRDLDVSKEIPVDCDYSKVYAVDSLPYSAALLLLKKNVGMKDYEYGEFVGELQKIGEVAMLCHGVPWLLILAGEDLYLCREKDHYDFILKNLKYVDFASSKSGILSEFIFKQLEVDVQNAFLDICTFFINREWSRVRAIVGKKVMDKLEEKHLVQINDCNRVSADAICKSMAQEMAKKQNNRFIINNPESSAEIEFDNPETELKNNTQIRGLLIYGRDTQSISLPPRNLQSLRLFESYSVTVEFKEEEGHTSLSNLKYFPSSQPKHNGVVEFLFKGGDPLVPIEVFSLHNVEAFHELPMGLWRMQNLRVLEITSCRNLESLPPDLTHLHCLEQLNLEYSEMLNYLPEDLGMLTRLEELILTGCSRLQALPFSICLLQFLKKLDMAGCASISNLPEGFGKQGLEELILTGCSGLQVLPDSICSLQSLKKLDMAGCASISSLPEGLGKLGLEKLILTGCSSLKALPDSICRLHFLKKLDMAGCASISGLPKDFGELGLEELILTGCSSLKALPRSICRSRCLKKLDLTGCKSILRLPDSTSPLELEELILTGCSGLQAVPDSIFWSRCLKKLDLTGCKSIKSLPKGGGNAGLEEMILTGCSSLQVLPDSICRSGNLKKLDLTGCKSILRLPDDMGCEQLEELILTECSCLQALPDSICVLQRLMKLDMAGCTSIFNLPKDLRMYGLKELILRGCSSLQALPDSIGWSNRLTKLDMAGCACICNLPKDLKISQLKELILTGCSNLQALPNSIYWSCGLKKLDLSGCASILRLPNNMKMLPRQFEELILTGCSRLQALPDSICSLKCLKKLDMAGCASISSLPKGLGEPELEELILRGCSSLQALPESICLLQCLKKLDMAGCASISSLPEAMGQVGQLGSLEIIDLSSCSNLEGLPSNLSGLVSLKELNLKNCRKFKALPSQLRDNTSLEKLIFTKSKKATYGGFWKHSVPS